LSGPLRRSLPLPRQRPLVAPGHARPRPLAAPPGRRTRPGRL